MAENNKWNDENPWLGLGAYNEGQQLYGRDKETASLTDIIANHSTVVVYGKSGIGKSSLLRAGVFPRLRQRMFVPIYLRLAHNTDIPYSQQIENAIKENVVINDMLPRSIPDLGLWDFLHRHRFTDADGNSVVPVIVFDQFEEIFTLTQVDHKPDVQALFSELADVLNDVKPDRVIESETAYVQNSSQVVANVAGFTLHSLAKSSYNYEKSPLFRLVLSLRDDSLYLLERVCAKIPALKANRFNLCALDEDSAMAVIIKPRPDLFTDTEARKILDGLAYYEYDDYRVVDPAILSLFLFSYYREQGKLAYTDIFERYYLDCTKDIKNSTVFYLEDHLLTERGNRNQIPVDEILDAGITSSDLDLLLQRKIVKTEKRKGLDYVEFSHDRLCEQAQKHREERKLMQQAQKMRKRMAVTGLIALLMVGIIGLLLWQNSERLQARLTADMASAKARVSAAKADVAEKEKNKANWEKDSIAKLNLALEDWRKITEAQNIRLQSDSVIRERHLARILKDSILLEQKRDSLRVVNDTLTSKLSYIQSLIELTQGMTLYNACISMRDAIEEGNMKNLGNANNVFKSCNTHYWGGSLMSKSEQQVSFKGHFIFSPIFVDSLIAYGNKVYELADHYNKIQSWQGAVADKYVNYRTCMVGALSSVKYSFVTKGHQELAFVTEPKGVINVRIHDKTHNVWHNEDMDLPYRFFTIEFPRKSRSILEVEVVNKTNADVSFVIISN